MVICIYIMKNNTSYIRTDDNKIVNEIYIRWVYTIYAHFVGVNE
jgi:hypothetical protein